MFSISKKNTSCRGSEHKLTAQTDRETGTDGHRTSLAFPPPPSSPPPCRPPRPGGASAAGPSNKFHFRVHSLKLCLYNCHRFGAPPLPLVSYIQISGVQFAITAFYPPPLTPRNSAEFARESIVSPARSRGVVYDLQNVTALSLSSPP